MSKRLHACLWLLLIMLAGANVLLIRQNLQMRRTIKGLEPQRLKAGERVQPFTAPGMNGEPVEVSYRGAGPKQVLLFLTHACTYCQQQAPYWRELLARIDAARFEVIGLVDQNEDRTKLQDYLSKIKPEPGGGRPLRVAFIPPDVRRGYKLSETPITLLVGNDGTVEEIWAGRWTGTDLAAVSAALDFDTPLR